MKDLIIILVLLILLITLFRTYISEGFIPEKNFLSPQQGKALFNEPILNTIANFRVRKTLFINMKEDDFDITLDQQLSKYKGIRLNKSSSGVVGGHNLFYTDVMTYINDGLKENHHVLTPMFFGKLAAFITTDELESKVSSLEEFNDENNILYYIDKNDIQLIDIIMKANGVVNYNLQQLSKRDMNKFFDKQNQQRRAFFTFTTMNSPLMKKIQSYDFNVVLYEQIDTQKLKAALPFARREMVSLERSQVSEDDEESVFSFFAVMIDTVLYGHKKMYSDYFSDLLLFQNVPKLINFYTQYFTFYPISMEFIKAENTHIIERGEKNILEQFEQKPKTEVKPNEKINFIINYNIPGTVDYKYKDHHKIFTYNGNILDNVTLRSGDRIELKKQDFERENGLYYVDKVTKKTFMTSSIMMDFDNKELDLIKDKVRNKEFIFPKIKSFDKVVGNLKLIKNDKLYFKDIDKFCRFDIDLVKRTWYCEVLNREPLPDIFDPRFRCYGDPEDVNKFTCESDKDQFGINKKEKKVWDRACEKDTDCPFFQTNKNRPQSLYRGGCNSNGFCEFPVGIKRLSYRKYDDNDPNKPMCRNCKEGSFFFNCCEDQKDKKKYPNLKGPDYIFEHEETQQMFIKD